MYSTIQSAYRQYHSCETALVKVANDILLNLDKGEEALLLLLDYKAAFDTIIHEKFLSRLQERYGIRGVAFDLIKSYFQNRMHKVVIGGSMSDAKSSSHGVPQGSVFGPVAFSLYVAPLYDIICKHNLKGMMYADDTQVYVLVKKGHQGEAILQIQACMTDIKNWSVKNGLKLNEEKTEVIHFRSKFRQSESIDTISFGNTVINTVDSARNLGVRLDEHLALSGHVKHICKAASFALHKIGTIRPFLSKKSTERLVHAHVISRLDFCNGILYGLPENEIQKLQRIQNSAARLVTCTRLRDHITPILEKLHWLPIRQRIEFKILTLVFLCLHELGPDYLQELITKYCPTRNLRSQSKSQLVSRTVSTVSYGARSFQQAASELWNKLPMNLRQTDTLDNFKSLLKTHLFYSLK